MSVNSQNFTASGPVSLDVQNNAGSIRLTAADTDTIEVEVRPGTNKQRDEDACRDTEISFDERRSVLVVHAPKQILGRGSNLHMTITVPTRSTVRAHAGSADITGTGLFGGVDGACGSGDVRFDDVEGEAEFKSGSGDIRFGAVTGNATAKNGSGNIDIGTVSGNADVNSASGNVSVASAVKLKIGTASGNIQAGTVTGPASANSASGDIDIRSVAGDTRAKAVSGDVQIGIAPGVVAKLDGSSVSGRVSSSLEVDDSAPVDAGARPISVHVSTVSGDISIDRAGSR
ncbi:MAG TPA: DUF4097 family beta strand repeat-containing protein [Mycobacteriales bacterium]|nr:DUF4097 family beta strand repeat-containing protein [Mycobacteriales bacterium]